MLNNEFKNQYLRVLTDYDKTRFRYPHRSMTERLQTITLLVAQYTDADCYGQGVLVNQFAQQMAELLGSFFATRPYDTNHGFRYLGR